VPLFCEKNGLCRAVSSEGACQLHFPGTYAIYMALFILSLHFNPLTTNTFPSVSCTQHKKLRGLQPPIVFLQSSLVASCRPSGKRDDRTCLVAWERRDAVFEARFAVVFFATGSARSVKLAK
jgi:hypothetical protein